jgi:hypothetical protein
VLLHMAVLVQARSNAIDCQTADGGYILGNCRRLTLCVTLVSGEESADAGAFLFPEIACGQHRLRGRTG